MYCSAKKAVTVAVKLSPNEVISAKTVAEMLRVINTLIAGATHGQGDYEDFFYNVYGIIEFLTDLSDNPERAEKELAEYINALRDEDD